MPNLSIIIPALEEADNLASVLPAIHAVMDRLGIAYEVIVVDEAAGDDTRAVVAAHGARLLCPPTRGYGLALLAGWRAARGPYIATLDADQSHPPDFLGALYAARDSAEIVIASRYIRGGQADMTLTRRFLSQALNKVFSRALSLGVRDMSSGFRLYRADVLRRLDVQSPGFEILQEVLVRAMMEGYRVREVPFSYQPRQHGVSHARVVRLGVAYLRTLRRLWTVRNSIDSADYDARAHDSVVLPQRYWQRMRYRHITDLVPAAAPCLDVGCGSSRIIGALPAGSVALDVLRRKLRYNRRYSTAGIQAAGQWLPFADASFHSVLCSQVIEHIPRERILDELDRVLAPGGRLVLGTPDYANWQWRWTERAYGLLMPNAYADEHITHYTRALLLEEFVHRRGYTLEDERYILRGEMILALRKKQHSDGVADAQASEIPSP